MTASGKTTFLVRSAVAFAGIPLLIWGLGDAHTRGLVKESLSILAILALCQMIVLCFWSRVYAGAVKSLKKGTLIRWHKIIGYTCIAIMLFHPLMPIVPKLLESGTPPVEAFVTLVTTFNQGVVLGIGAWCCMLLLFLTALARFRLPMKYTTWRVFHGTLAMLFIILAVWHVLDLGRHATTAMALYINLLATGSVLFVAGSYLVHPEKRTGRI